MNVGAVAVACPECEAVIDIPVTAELTEDDEGRQWLACEPDMADLWAHAWRHDAL